MGTGIQPLIRALAQTQHQPPTDWAAAHDLSRYFASSLKGNADPDQRHGGKSSSKRFNGHKGSIATDLDSQIIVDADVLSGSAPDAQGALARVERVEENTGQTGAEALGECAYGSGATRQAFAEAQREWVAKVPQEGSNRGLFPKSAFGLNMLDETVTCPAGQSTGKFTLAPDGGKLFRFGAVCRGCPPRERCTTAAGGRTLQMPPREERLQAARAYQATEAGRAHPRERVRDAASASTGPHACDRSFSGRFPAALLG